MKKLSILMLGLFLISLSIPAFAQYDREENKNVGYVNVNSRSSDGVIVGRPVFVYAVTLYPSSTNASVNLYDNASAASGTIKAEVSDPTQYNSERYVYDPPLKYENGVYADVTSGAVVVEYR